MEIFLHIGLAEADDALDEMREHGLEFETVSVEQDLENGSCIVTASVNNLSEFLDKLNAVKDEDEYSLEMLISITDEDDNCHFEYWYFKELTRLFPKMNVLALSHHN